MTTVEEGVLAKGLAAAPAEDDSDSVPGIWGRNHACGLWVFLDDSLLCYQAFGQTGMDACWVACMACI